MYHVIQLYGDCEPWWFLDGWEEDIVSREQFDSYEEAWHRYQQVVQQLAERLPQQKYKEKSMVAFWDPSDQTWCEACDEYLQQYHSLLLMDGQQLVLHQSTPSYPRQRLRPCQMKH